MTGLEVEVRHRQGFFLLDATFTAPGGLTALFGRSGSGKTTLVNAIAGLVRPGEGRIRVDRRTLLDTSRGIMLPTHHRRIGYVFQDARLFPHLSVRQNLHYGRWFVRRGERVDEGAVIDMLGIGHLLDRRPAALSGGEKQRVAIGRALLASPRLLLMDEPLASLDDARKAEILPFIERVRDSGSVPIVYVSHSVAEVARLATTVVVLAEGRVVAFGPAAQIIGRADLFEGEDRDETGSILESRIEGHDDAFNLTVLRCPAGRIYVPRIDCPSGTIILLRIRGRDVMLATVRPDYLSAQNILEGTIATISPHVSGSPVATVELDCHGVRLHARITRRACSTLGLACGREVFAIVKSVTFDPSTIGT